MHEEVKQKMKELEAIGWTFTRWSESRQAWVKCKSLGNRQLQKAIKHAWKEQFNNERMVP